MNNFKNRRQFKTEAMNYRSQVTSNRQEIVTQMDINRKKDSPQNCWIGI